MTHTNPQRFLGWWVVAAVFLLLTTNAGLTFYGLAVYLEALTSTRDLSTTVVSLATSVFFIVGGITGRLVAPLIERYDLRIVVAFGAVCSAVSLSLLGSITSTISLLGVYSLLAVGFACAGLVPATTLITRWFHERRSIALAIGSTGLSAGGLTFTRVASDLIESRGLDNAGPILGMMFLGTSAIALLAMWPNPAARGQTPDGVPADAATEAAALEGVPYAEAVRSRFFVVICAAFVLMMSSQVGGIAQLAKLGAERIDRATGVLAVSAVAAASVISRLIGGVVARHVPMVTMILVLGAVQAVALGLLAFSTSTVALVASAVLFGATIGNLLMLQPLLIADVFGVVEYPRIFAFQQLIVTGGVALGPFLLGWLRDTTSYQTSYLVAAGMSAAGAAVVMSGGSPGV